LLFREEVYAFPLFCYEVQVKEHEKVEKLKIIDNSDRRIDNNFQRK